MLYLAYGTADVIAVRLRRHLGAGADHAPVSGADLTGQVDPALAELPGPLSGLVTGMDNA
jgi:hypothetical protein